MLGSKTKTLLQFQPKKKACRQARFAVYIKDLAGYIVVVFWIAVFKDMPEITSWSAMQQPDYNGTVMEEASGHEYKTVSKVSACNDACNLQNPAWNALVVSYFMQT